MNFAQNKLPLVSRVVLGLIFTVFGLNGFFGFIPQPPPPEAAGAFLGGLASSGYFFPLLKGTEVIAGLLLLTGVWVPVALLALAPIVLNIVAFHLFLAPGAYAMLAVMVAASLHLAWVHRAQFAPLFMRAEPVSGSRTAQLRAPAAAAE
jgi:uncharacterized membrane protein YphA (DoxX/SURF4 family)